MQSPRNAHAFVQIRESGPFLGKIEAYLGRFPFLADTTLPWSTSSDEKGLADFGPGLSPWILAQGITSMSECGTTEDM